MSEEIKFMLDTIEEMLKELKEPMASDFKIILAFTKEDAFLREMIAGNYERYKAIQKYPPNALKIISYLITRLKFVLADKHDLEIKIAKIEEKIT